MINNETKEFYEITKEKPPSPLLVEAVKIIERKENALDLGCGAGKGRILVSYLI